MCEQFLTLSQFSYLLPCSVFLYLVTIKQSLNNNVMFLFNITSLMMAKKKRIQHQVVLFSGILGKGIYERQKLETMPFFKK